MAAPATARNRTLSGGRSVGRAVGQKKKELEPVAIVVRATEVDKNMVFC